MNGSAIAIVRSSVFPNSLAHHVASLVKTGLLVLLMAAVVPLTAVAQESGTPRQNGSASMSGFVPGILLRGFGGAAFINGNTPATAGFDGAVLFPLGNRVLVGPTAGFQWVDSSIVQTIGGGPAPSTFIHTSAGFKNGNFGGQIVFPVSGFQLGLRGGATVAGSSITQATGFCGSSSTNPTGSSSTCTTTSTTTTTHDTVVGPFVGGYVSHSIFSHVGIFVEADYAKLKDQTTTSSGVKASIFDLNSSAVVGGVVLNLFRHETK